MDHSFIDSSSKSLFINTTKEPSLAGIGVNTRKSALSKKTNYKFQTRSIDEETNHASKSMADLKMVLDLKNDIREKMATFEERFATKDEIAEAVDKLGEEIAFDINQLENGINEAKTMTIIPPDKPTHDVPSNLERLVDRAVGRRNEDQIKTAIRVTTQDLRYQMKK